MERINHPGPTRPVATTRERMVRSGLRVVREAAVATFVPRVIPFGRPMSPPGARIPSTLTEE